MRKTTFLLKKVLLLVVSMSICTGAVLASPIEISNRSELEAIASDLSGSYILTADIDLTGTDWVPLGSNANPFTGGLDGNGHVISGLRYDNTAADNTDYPEGSRKIGLFSVISGGTVKKLGIELAYVKGGKHVGAIAGSLKSGAIVEECYVGHSYIETGDHGGSIVGNMEGGSVVRNCYANGEVFSRGAQGSGLVGMFKDDQTTISKSYFSGIVRSNNPSGIGAWKDGGKPVCEYSVNLAPFILGASNLRTCVGHDPTVRTELYSLASTLLDGNKNNFSASGGVPTYDGNYGTTKRHGANIPGGDLNALTQDFYKDVLGWDFDNVWGMPAKGYPVLKWQSTSLIKVSVVAIKGYERYLFSPSSLNLYNYIYLSNILQSRVEEVIKFSSESADVEISDEGIITVSETGKTKTGTIDITVQVVAKTGYQLVGETTSFTVGLKPEVTEIATISDLQNIASDMQAAYKLTADLDFTGETFTCLGEFKGCLDGNGHVIKGLTYNSPSNDDNGKNVGLFKTIKNAHIKNLGIEGVNFNGYNDVAALAGQAYGFSVIENCYVANSYIEGRDHVASIVGGLRDGSIIRNCYSNALVHSREHQAGGLTGVISKGAIYNSYYAGIVSNDNNRAVGIGGYQDNASIPKDHLRVENSVSLAPHLLSNNWDVDAVRVLHDAGGRPCTLINNYGLSTAWRGLKDYSAGELVSLDLAKIGTDKLHGANVTPQDAKSQAFYETTLGWDFVNTWKMLESGYPVLKWQTTPVNASVLTYKAEYDLEKDNASGLDLAFLIPNTHGFNYVITPADPAKVAVEGTVIKVADAWNASSVESTSVTLSSPAGISFSDLVINLSLIPTINLSDISINGTTITGFDPTKTDYDLYYDEVLTSITLGATPINPANTFGENELGEKTLKIGQNTYSITVSNAGGFSKTYHLNVHNGLFSVFPDLHGTGKRKVNVHSGIWNNNDESPFKLLFGKQAVPVSSFGSYKWCPSNAAEREPWVIFSFSDVYEVSAVAFRDKNFRESGDHQIDKWKVEISMDGQIWETVVDVEGQTNQTYKYEEFSPKEARFLRFTPTKKEGVHAAWIYGFDIYGRYSKPIDNVVISRGKNILSYEGNYWEHKGRETPANILDGNHDGMPWASANKPLSVEIDLESVALIGGFNLVSDQQSSGFVSGYKVYLKETAEEEWSSPYDIADVPTEEGIQQRKHVLPAAVSARYVKLEIPADYANQTWTRIREFEVFNHTVITSCNRPSLGFETLAWSEDNQIYVNIKGELDGNVQLHNIMGQHILSQRLDNNQTVLNVKLGSGIYLVTVSNLGVTKTVKVLIK